MVLLVGYVYQSANFLYGGFIWSDVYISKTGEKVHFRTIQRKMIKEMNRQDTKYENNDEKMGELGFTESGVNNFVTYIL